MFSIWSACERDISRCEYVQDCGSWSFEANKYCMFLPTRTMGFCCVFTHQRDDKLKRFFLLSTRRSNKTVSRISFSHSQILTGGFLDAVVCRTKLYWRYFSLSSKNYILSPFHLSILSLILYFLFYLRSWGEYIYIYIRTQLCVALLLVLFRQLNLYLCIWSAPVFCLFFFLLYLYIYIKPKTQTKFLKNEWNTFIIGIFSIQRFTSIQENVV